MACIRGRETMRSGTDSWPWAPGLLLALAMACGASGVGWAQAAGGTAARPAPNYQCHQRKTPLSDAEAALSRGEYEQALDLFGKMADKDLGRAGVIRTLLEQDKVMEARAQAEAWTAAEPKNALALETLGEVLFRAGKPDLAYRKNQEAVAEDHCLARAFLMDAAYEDITAYFARSKGHIELAHKLDAVDPEIERSWISTLPKKRRIEEWTRLAADEHLESEAQRKRLLESIAHMGDYSSKDCSVVQAVPETTVPIQLILDGPHNVEGLALDVKFNGKRRRLEIDTGASGLTLSRGAASSLGLTRERQIESFGVGDKGNVTTSRAHVASVQIGNLEFRNCVVDILEKRSALDIDGLIGGDVFAKYLLTLDYPKLQLRLDQLPPRPDEKPAAGGLETVQTKVAGDGIEAGDEEEATAHDRYVAPEMKDWTPVYRSGSDLLIPVRVGAAQERLFLVDTGAASMLISPDAASEVTKVKRNGDLGIQGISGKVDKVYETGKFTFQFAHLRQTVEHMTSIDTSRMSHADGMEVSGFLGDPVLLQLAVHIDYRDNLMKFDYTPRN